VIGFLRKKFLYNYHERYGKTHIFFPLYTFWGLRFTFFGGHDFFKKHRMWKPTVQTKNFGIMHNSLFVGILSSLGYTLALATKVFWQTLIYILVIPLLALLSYIFALTPQLYPSATIPQRDRFFEWVEMMDEEARTGKIKSVYW